MSKVNINPSQVEGYLHGADFPASRDELIEHAQHQGANEQICEMLRQLPAQRYSSASEVSKALSNIARSARN